MRGKDKLVLFTMVILSTERLRPSNSTREEFLSQTKDDYQDPQDHRPGLGQAQVRVAPRQLGLQFHRLKVLLQADQLAMAWRELLENRKYEIIIIIPETKIATPTQTSTQTTSCLEPG